jgi:hypothetical protein
MSFPDIPDGMGVPLVNLDDHLLPDATMDALDERYAGASGSVMPGGTTGQVYTKDSEADNDASWQTPDPGVQIDDDATSTTETWSSDKIDSEIVSAVGAVQVVPYLPVAGQTIHTNGSTASSAAAGNALTLVPIVVTHACHIDALISRANATAAGTHDIALYSSLSSGAPDFSTGPIVSATVSHATNQIVVTSVASTALQPGLYWGAFRRGATITMTVKTSSTLPFSPINDASAAGYSDTGQTALPSPSFTPTPGGNCVAVSLRIASVP